MVEITDGLKKTLDAFLKEIESICSLDRVILFGSLAKGTGSKDSDIDLAIFSKSANDCNRLDLMAKIFTKISKYKLDIQPLVFNFADFVKPDNAFIEKEIKEQGKIIR